MARRKITNDAEGREEGGQVVKTDPTLAIIASQLEQIATQQRLIAANQEALKVEVDQQLAAFRRQLLNEQQAAQQGLQAAMEQWEESIKHTVMSKEELARQLELTRQESEKINAVKRQRFEEHLNRAPKGTIASFYEGVVELQINGHKRFIRPGLNKNIPQPFIQAWEDHVDATTTARQRNNLIADQVLEGGILDNWRDEGRSGSISEIPVDGPQ